MYVFTRLQQKYMVSRLWPQSLCLFSLWVSCGHRPLCRKMWGPDLLVQVTQVCQLIGLRNCLSLTQHAWFGLWIVLLEGWWVRRSKLKTLSSFTDQATPQFLFVLWAVWSILRSENFLGTNHWIFGKRKTHGFPHFSSDHYKKKVWAKR